MSDYLTIDDSNYQDFIDPWVDGERKWCKSYGVFTQDSEGYSGTFGDLGISLIDSDEWRERAQEQERKKVRMIDLAMSQGMAIRNQRNSNYCWAFGTTRSAEYAILQTGVNRHISAFSVGSPVKNFRNVGGWGDQALAYMRNNGFNWASEWPDSQGRNSISRRYYTSENREKAKQRKVVEYFKLRSGRGGWDEVVSCILQGIAVAVGYNWWSHLVCGTWITPRLDLGIDNSWGSGWSNSGRGVLSGGRKYPDGAVAIVATAAI